MHNLEFRRTPMFGRQHSLFRLFGIRVNVDTSWIFLFILVTWSLAMAFFPAYYPGLSEGTYWLMGLVGAVGLFASIVFHEVSHSLVARYYGMPIKSITLFIFGGVANMQDEPTHPKAEFLMALAGPLLSIAIGVAMFGIFELGELMRWPQGIQGVIHYLGWINLVLAAFNLVPGFPLDGGRLLRAVIWKWRGNLRQATRLASGVGSFVGFILIVLGIIGIVTGKFVGGLWWILIGMFLRFAAKTSYRQVLIKEALKGEGLDHFMTREVVTVEPDLSISDFVGNYVYRYHHQMFPVVHHGLLVGCVETNDLKRIPRGDWETRTVSDLVQSCHSGNTMDISTDAEKALAEMTRTGNSRWLVTQNNQLVGVITLKDLMKFISLKMDLESDPGSTEDQKLWA